MEQTCPNCHTGLAMTRFTQGGVYFGCKSCEGRSVGVDLLRRISTPPLIQKIWMTAKSRGQQSSKTCPACEKRMSVFPAGNETVAVELDVCTTCHLIWFDADEFSKIPKASAEDIRRRDEEAQPKRTILDTTPIHPLSQPIHIRHTDAEDIFDIIVDLAHLFD